MSEQQGWQHGSKGGPDVAADGTTAMPGADLEQLRELFRRSGIGNPLPTLAVGTIAYVAALAAATVTMISTLIALALGGSGDSSGTGGSGVATGTGDALDGIGVLFRMPFQLLALGTLGSWGGTAQIPLAGTAHVSVRFLPFLITLVLVGVAALGGRFVQRHGGGGVLGIWLWSLLSGFGVALVVVLGALIFAEKMPAELELGTARFHAAGVDTFFGAWMMTALGLALGRHSGRPRPSWWPVVVDLTASLRMAAVHAVGFGVVMAVLGLIGITVRGVIEGEPLEGPAALFALPLGGGAFAAYAAGMAALSSMRISGDGQLLGSTNGMLEGGTIFHLPWYVWIITLLAGLVGIGLASLVWQYQRRVLPGNLIAIAISWVALPGAYFTGGIVLMIIAYGGFSMEAGMWMSVDTSITLAAWTPMLTLLVGIAVELLSRFVAPFVTPWIPGVLLRWFRGRRPVGAEATDGAGSPATAPGAPAPGNPGTPAPGGYGFVGEPGGSGDLTR